MLLRPVGPPSSIPMNIMIRVGGRPLTINLVRLTFFGQIHHRICPGVGIGWVTGRRRSPINLVAERFDFPVRKSPSFAEGAHCFCDYFGVACRLTALARSPNLHWNDRQETLLPGGKDINRQIAHSRSHGGKAQRYTF